MVIILASSMLGQSRRKRTAIRIARFHWRFYASCVPPCVINQIIVVVVQRASPDSAIVTDPCDTLAGTIKDFTRRCNWPTMQNAILRHSPRCVSRFAECLGHIGIRCERKQSAIDADCGRGKGQGCHVGLRLRGRDCPMHMTIYAIADCCNNKMQ
jgi:hypothetical protein